MLFRREQLVAVEHIVWITIPKGPIKIAFRKAFKVITPIKGVKKIPRDAYGPFLFKALFLEPF